MCENPLPLDKFALEGKGRIDKDGNPKRRKVCNRCRWLLRKGKAHSELKAKSSGLRYCALCDKELSVKKFNLSGKKTKEKMFCLDCKKNLKNGKFNEKDLLEAEQRLAVYRLEQISDAVVKQEIKDNRERLISAIIELSRSETSRLESLTEEEFIHKTRAKEIVHSIDASFKELKREAKLRLLNLGFHHPEGLKLGAGRYLIVGDSHGKHMKRKMFKLLKNVNKNLNIDKIIHVGHILDDDNVISYCWKDFDNVIVLAKLEESKTIERHFDLGHVFDVVRNHLFLGELKVMNQDLVSDYVKTAVGNIDQAIYPKSMIVNSHKHEIDTRCTYKNVNIIASPGCLCEKHIVKTIKQIDFTAGYQVRQAKSESFIKYRKMKHMYEFWEQGMLLVEVERNGNFSITPMKIQPVDDEYATSFFDKIYVGDKVKKPDKKIFINADMHCDLHDKKVLHIQDQVVKDYKPDIYVNLGDMMNNAALNHHVMEKGGVITRSMLEENASVAYIMKTTSAWAKEKYLFFGNHERFLKDFYDKYPQLKEMLMTLLESICEQNGFELVDHLDVLELGSLKFIHGNMRMFGQRGNLLEKTARTFGKDTVIGHLHFTAIRFGCYLIGMTGLYDQKYNEVNALRWVHGMGTCNQYKGNNWIANHSIINYQLLLNGKKYQSNRTNFWSTPEYDVSVVYDFD